MIATNHAYKSPLYTFTENTIKSPVFWYFQDYIKETLVRTGLSRHKCEKTW